MTPANSLALNAPKKGAFCMRVGIDNRGGGGIGNGNTFIMENSWWMRGLVYLCTSRGYIVKTSGS
jgi:hypothetical protein